MASRSNHPVYRNGGDTDNDDLESGSSNYHAMSTQQLERRREEDLARQEGMLDQIHTGVQGLNHHARAIDNEVEGQNVLINDIGSRMDRAQQEIERQDAVARLVNAQKKKVRDE